MYRIHSRTYLCLCLHTVYTTAPMHQQRLAYYACLPYFCLFVCAQDTHPNPAPTTYVLHSLVLQYSRSAPVHDIDG